MVSRSGMKCLNVLYAMRLLMDSGGVGLSCISQFAKVSRSTAHRELIKAQKAGYVDVTEVPYRKSFACRYRLSDEGEQLMGIPF